MRWASREPVPPGTQRTLLRFAFLPVLRTTTKEWVWLEFYWKQQVYEYWTVFEGMGDIMQEVHYHGWKTVAIH